MTPKDTANNIAMKMFDCDTITEDAIVAVDVVLNELQTYSDLESVIVQNGIPTTVIERIQFWNEVKNELEIIK